MLSACDQMGCIQKVLVVWFIPLYFVGLIVCGCMSEYVVIFIVARWCVVNEMEHAKCTDLTNAITAHILQGRNTTVGAYQYQYNDLPNLQCVQGLNQYDCMIQIFNDQADMMQLETGLSYTAGQYYNMMPLAAEKYQPGCYFIYNYFFYETSDKFRVKKGIFNVYPLCIIEFQYISLLKKLISVVMTLEAPPR